MLRSPARNTRNETSDAGRAGPRVVLPLLLIAGLIAAPLPMEAQDDDGGPRAGTVSFDVSGGLAVPLDELLDEVVDTGATFGGGVAYHVTRAFALRADVEYQTLSGATDNSGVTFADMDAVYATAGPEVHFTSPDTRWAGSLSLGAGVTTLETDDSLDSGALPPVTADLTSPAFRGGMKLAYSATDVVDVYLEPAVYLILFDREDTRPFGNASTEISGPSDVGWMLPIQVGARFHVP